MRGEAGHSRSLCRQPRRVEGGALLICYAFESLLSPRVRVPLFWIGETKELTVRKGSSNKTRKATHRPVAAISLTEKSQRRNANQTRSKSKDWTMASQLPLLAKDVPRVGVAAIIRDAEGKMLVGVRKGSHGAGTYLPRSALLYPFPCSSTRTSRTSSQATCHDGLRAFPTALFC